MPLRMQELVGAAFLLVLAIMLTVFACTLIPGEKNTLIIMALVFYLFSPIPFALCGSMPQQNDFMSAGGNQEHPLVAIGHFLTGMFFAAGPCTALVLYHTENISAEAMLMSFGSGVFVVAAVFVILRAVAKPPEETF